MPVEGIESIAQNPSWLKKEIEHLLDKTMLLFLFTSLFCGSLFGYFVVSEVIFMVQNPVKKVTHAYVGDSYLQVDVETKEPVMAKVEYGTTADALNEFPISSSYEDDHSVVIKGLLPKKSHSFRVILEDPEGHTHTSDFFTAE